MQKMTLAIAFAILVFLSPVQAGNTEQTVISGSDGTHNHVNCDGRVAKVTGTNNVIQYEGICAGLSVFGSGNTISISLKPESSIRIEGSDNTIEWVSAKAPRVTTTGLDNTVGRKRY